MVLVLNKTLKVLHSNLTVLYKTFSGLTVIVTILLKKVLKKTIYGFLQNPFRVKLISKEGFCMKPFKYFCGSFLSFKLKIS